MGASHIFELRVKTLAGIVSSRGKSTRSRGRAGRIWLVVMLAAAIIVPLSVRAEPNANLTSNWSVESWGNVYDWYDGYPLQIASDWGRFSSTQSDKLPRFMRDDDYASRFAGSGAIPRHIEGSYSQNVWSGRDFVAGIYQQVTVTRGEPYAAKSWMLTVCGSTVPDPDGKMLKDIGIDPHGGTDPTSSDIVWGETDGQDTEYVDVRTAARATSETVTVFVRVRSPEYVMPDWNAAWMDAIVLAEAPTVSASSPEFSADTNFLVSWTNGQAATGGSLTGQYDVQYKDGVDGEWITWKSKKSSTPDTFPYAVVGHTYYFRARAWQEYDPEGIDLYGAYSEEGDTHTTVGRVATGYVRGNTGFAVSGATVAIEERATSTVTDRTGHYQIALPGIGSYGLTVSKAGYASPPAVPFTVEADTIVVPINLTVRPPVEAVDDGDFEGSLSAHWTASGSPLPQVQDQEVRSGAKSLELCNAATVNQSRVEQSFSVTGMYKPVLSFYAKIPQGGPLSVGRTEPDPVALPPITGAYPDWTHFHIPLDVGEVYTGTLGISFEASASSNMQVYIDEVSVGRSPGGPNKTYCPVIFK